MASKHNGFSDEQIEILSEMEEEKANRVVDVMVGGADMWGDYGLNGHYWCELPDGKIIDGWFDNYDECRKAMLIKNKVLVHYPCPNPITTAVMLKKAKTLVDAMGGDEINALLFEKNRPQKCMFNAIANCYKYGGTLRFGSLGINTDCGGITIWIYGNETFKTFNDFVKQGEGGCWTVRDQKKAEKYCKKLGVSISRFETK
jgi:hypothetical protein